MVGGRGGVVGSGDLLWYSCFFMCQLLPITSPLEKGSPGNPSPPPSSSFGGELVEGGRRRADVQGLSLAHLLLLAERDSHLGLPAPRARASLRLFQGPSFQVSNSLSGSLAWGRSQGRVGDGPLGSPASCGARNPLTPRFTVASTEQSVRPRPARRLAAFVLRSDRTHHQGLPCVGTATLSRLSREGKLEEIGAPGM